MPDSRFRSGTLSDEERECLILQHLPQVHFLARRIYGRLPENVCLDDLVSAGVVGLIAAVDRFDSSRRVELKAYAAHKIQGGILDSLRLLDWAPRTQRERSKQIAAAIAAAEQRLHRAPTDQEIAAELKIPLDRYRRWQANVCRLNIERLDTAESEDRDPMRLPPRDPRELPSSVFERRELRRALAGAISGLPKIHQTVLTMYYRDDLRLREISRIIGVHESRISRIRAQAIRKLRACLAKLWPMGLRKPSPSATL